MSLKRITFTGVDERTDINELDAICSARWPFHVEFAVLWSESRAGKAPRYPAAPIGVVSRIPRGHGAIHLCGAVAREFAKGPPLSGLLSELACLGRIQVNLPTFSHQQIVDLGWLSKALQVEVIVQSRGNKALFLPGIATLHDHSGGTGKVPEQWPQPEWVYQRDDVVSYAGGLSPDNIETELPRIAAARGEGAFAIDMESGVRTNDWFDISKVCWILEAAENWALRDLCLGADA